MGSLSGRQSLGFDGHSCDGLGGAAAWLRVWHTRLSRASSGPQGRAISSLLTGVSQLRTWIMQMSTDAAALLGFAAVCTGFVRGSFQQVAFRELKKIRRNRCVRFC